MRIAVFLATITIVFSCKNINNGVDYDNLEVGKTFEYARLFSVVDSGYYHRLDIFSPWQGGDDIVITYYLIEDDSIPPGDINPSHIIKIPVTTSVCMSTTHIAMIDAVGSVESVVGVSGTDYVTNEIVRSGITDGKVKDIGYDSNMNSELIALLNPDIVFVYGIGSESAGYLSKLKEVGIPALYICDYMEVHPLAKAEWVKLFGLLFMNSDEADSLFISISDNYLSIRDEITENIINRPKVMLGLPYKDKWFVSPGNSYINTLINDAGGDYIWKDILSKESMPLSIESVFSKALNSEYWLNIGAVNSIDELLAVDPRFKGLPPVKSGHLYNNVLKINPMGGNDYWESGALYPDRVLKDIAAVLHPEIFPDHHFYYYKKID